MLDTLRQRYHGHAWTPVTLGMSGARVWRVEGTAPLYVKTTEHAQFGDTGESLIAEAARMTWFRSHGVPVPDVVDCDSDGQFAWLVTNAVHGRTAADPWAADRLDAVTDALADFAVSLHALPTDACPFDRSLAVTIPQAHRAAADGRLDLADLDAERAGWSPARLVAALDESSPVAEDLVVCHGDFCLPNVLLAPESLAVTGIIDLGRAGVADRHMDVALITRSIAHEMNEQYGAARADRFTARYETAAGVTIDPSKIGFYRLLDEFA